MAFSGSKMPEMRVKNQNFKKSLCPFLDTSKKHLWSKFQLSRAFLASDLKFPVILRYCAICAQKPFPEVLATVPLQYPLRTLQMTQVHFLASCALCRWQNDLVYTKSYTKMNSYRGSTEGVLDPSPLGRIGVGHGERRPHYTAVNVYGNRNACFHSHFLQV